MTIKSTENQQAAGSLPPIPHYLQEKDSVFSYFVQTKKASETTYTQTHATAVVSQTLTTSRLKSCKAQQARRERIPAHKVQLKN